jgi:hypothetical protein
LIYVPGVFAAQCPSNVEVKARVVQNLGADPFRDAADRTATMVVDGDPGNADGAPRPKTVRIEIVDANSASLGTREIDGDERCDELVAAAALALAIALDPARAFAPEPPAPIRPRVLLRDTPVTIDPIASILPEGTRVTFGVGGHSGAMLTPAVQFGAHLGASWRGDWWGLGAELRTDAPAGFPAGAGMLTALPCAHIGLLNVRETDALGIKTCVSASAGAAWSLRQPVEAGPYAGVGVRVGAEWVMADASAIGVWAQVEWSGLRPSFSEPTSVIGGSPVNAALGATFELGWPQ